MRVPMRWEHSAAAASLVVPGALAGYGSLAGRLAGRRLSPQLSVEGASGFLAVLRGAIFAMYIVARLAIKETKVTLAARRAP